MDVPATSISSENENQAASEPSPLGELDEASTLLRLLTEYTNKVKTSTERVNSEKRIEAALTVLLMFAGVFVVYLVTSTLIHYISVRIFDFANLSSVILLYSVIFALLFPAFLLYRTQRRRVISMQRELRFAVRQLSSVLREASSFEQFGTLNHLLKLELNLRLFEAEEVVRYVATFDRNF